MLLIECPNCRKTMKNNFIGQNSKIELWHICPKCGWAITNRGYEKIKKIVLRLFE
jgi:ribosomal protein L37AE/L43A